MIDFLEGQSLALRTSYLHNYNDDKLES